MDQSCLDVSGRNVSLGIPRLWIPTPAHTWPFGCPERMVPDAPIEEAFREAAEVPQGVFAVTAVADQRKGKSLAVIHTFAEDEISEVIKKLGGMGLPNIFVPRKDRFRKVEALPLLGTGKLKLREIKRLAQEAFRAES